MTHTVNGVSERQKLCNFQSLIKKYYRFLYRFKHNQHFLGFIYYILIKQTEYLESPAEDSILLQTPFVPFH